jgi:hypothetical protein
MKFFHVHNNLEKNSFIRDRVFPLLKKGEALKKPSRAFFKGRVELLGNHNKDSLSYLRFIIMKTKTITASRTIQRNIG